MLSRAAQRLTLQQREFVDMHVLDGYPLYRAYLAAFPQHCASWNVASEKARGGMAANRATKLIRKPEVQAYVAELKARLAARSQSDRFLSLDEKRDFLARAVRTPIGEIHIHSDLASEIRPTPHGDVVKSVDKLAALQLDAKLAGELTERVDVNVSPRVVDLAQSLD
jgi:hypothetical protein